MLCHPELIGPGELHPAGQVEVDLQTVIRVGRHHKRSGCGRGKSAPIALEQRTSNPASETRRPQVFEHYQWFAGSIFWLELGKIG